MEEYEQLLIDAIVLSRVISDELKEDSSYQNVVRVADELKLEPYQVNQFLQLYKHVQQFMLI